MTEQYQATTGQVWDAQAYARNGRFVADMAEGVVTWLDAKAGEQILDIGCGDGVLTQRIAQATGATMTGLEYAPAMAAQARANGLNIVEGSATALNRQTEFDAVFSNAALHWIPERDQPEALARIYRAIKPGGRFVTEMGGMGNIAAIRVALQAVVTKFGIDAEEQADSFYPSPNAYRSLLTQAGFEVERMELIPRPTPFASGMEAWLNTFRNGVLDMLPAGERQKALDETVALLKPVLCDSEGNWSGDYVRLRFIARVV